MAGYPLHKKRAGLVFNAPFQETANQAGLGLNVPPQEPFPAACSPLFFPFDRPPPMLRVGAWICDNVALFCISQIPLFSFSVTPPPRFKNPPSNPKGLKA